MDIKSIFLGFFLGVVGTFFGSCFSYFFGERRRRKEDFNKAATAFRDAFRHEIAFLRYNTGIKGAQGSDGSIANFLHTGAVHRHTEALVTFRKHLSPVQRRSIDKAWKEYQTQIAGYNSVPMSEKDKETALEIIEAFLNKHAKLK